MSSRRLFQLAVAGATLAAGLGYAVPACAVVKYDPAAKTGYVDRGEVLTAFGWSAATLNQKAAGLAFSHDFWTDDRYAVTCGKKPFPVVHHREFGRFELADTVIRGARRGTATGYHSQPSVTGFRITGPRAGISGTSVPPAVGGPCPRPAAAKITKATLESTTTGWSLSVSSGAVSRRLLPAVSAEGMTVRRG